jgi:hypothetical protein
MMYFDQILCNMFHENQIPLAIHTKANRVTKTNHKKQAGKPTTHKNNRTIEK